MQLTLEQKRALSKLDTDRWCTAPSIDEYLCVLDALARKGVAEARFLKCSVVWRRK